MAMPDTEFDQILEGAMAALAHARGEDIGAVEHVVPVAPVDVKEVRRRLGMSQARFAAAFDVPLGTVQGWEQRRRTPRGSARVLLQIIDREPDAVFRALAPATDPTRVRIGEPWELAYWTRTLGVSEAELAAAIDRVGNGAQAVQEDLARPRTLRSLAAG